MRYIWVGLTCLVIFLAGIIGFAGYALRIAPELNRHGKPIVEGFYQKAQKHDYQGAYSLLAPNLQDVMTEADLAKRWQKFEQEHGALAKWTPAAGQPGAINLFPRYIDFDYLVLGKKGDGTRIFIRVVQVGPDWRISKLSLFS